MPFPYFDNISTDFTGVWTSPRKRKAPSSEQEGLELPPSKRKSSAASCPHYMTIVRATRQLSAEKAQCSICLEDYLSTPDGREKVIPVKIGCSHIFCRECIETHLSSSTKCPLPWCDAHLPLRPDACELCAAWARENAAAGSLVVTVRAREMLGSIKDALRQLAQDDDAYTLPKQAENRLLAHVRTTLKRYEWQFHTGIDLAELLDPFLLAINIADARKHYGSELSAPKLEHTQFPPREHDPDDYPPDEEPWIAAFFRQWALDYEKENGEIKEGWGVWSMKADDEASWEWPYKRIQAHKTGSDGHIEYLVKWVGQRHLASWVKREQLVAEARDIYDNAHGVSHRLEVVKGCD
ncbi:hypothetical protein J4E81_001980 [Alternaria sp. BMP 2799]|nr:hypothetical protein J4E81_001980 [Alternaria sp. BMP 2799]